jgi:hypothetical protein
MRVIGSHDFYDPDDFKWELYNINEDFSQANNLADKNPDKLRELQDAFDVEAKKYNVYPLDSSFGVTGRSCNPAKPHPRLQRVRLLSGNDENAPIGVVTTPGTKRAQIRLTGALAVGLLAGRNGPLV